MADGKHAEKKKQRKKYIVVFQDDDGTVLKTAFVPEGENAVPPEMQRKKGEDGHYEVLFSGWDTDYSKVQKNLVVRAVYKKELKNYLVMYFHENDKLLGMESVPYGKKAKAEVYPTKESDEEYDYVFTGWNPPLHCVEGDTSAKAVFEPKRKTFTVRFFHEDGALLKQERTEYGGKVEPPPEPVKQADKIYRYYFERWSEKAEAVRKNLDIVALFSSVYKEYSILFYDGESLLRSDKYHYGDEIIYPELTKKGYDLFWTKNPERADGEYEIHTQWRFSNPSGKVIREGKGVYEIMNPSVKNGSVRCISYTDTFAVRIVLPGKVKLGDYYYKIEKIGFRALKECRGMRILELPDTIKEIEAGGLSGCRQLRRIQFGKELSILGANAFAGDVRLKEMEFPGKRVKKCRNDTFEKTPGDIRIKVRKECREEIERLLKKARYGGKIHIV